MNKMKKLLRFLKDEEGVTGAESWFDGGLDSGLDNYSDYSCRGYYSSQNARKKAREWNKVTKRRLGGIERLRGREMYKRKPIWA